jgi:hypothetical protein
MGENFRGYLLINSKNNLKYGLFPKQRLQWK